MADYRLYIRDSSLRRIAEVGDYQKLDLVLRFNEVGSWALDMPGDSDPAQLLTWGGGLIVTRDGAPFYSGPVEKLNRRWNAKENTLVASGPDDLVYMKRRLALPVPGGPPYTSQAHDVRTGPAETVIKAYIEANVGTGATADRQVTGLTVAADTALGTSVTGRARFHNLLKFCQELALAGNDIGFRVVQVGTALEFQAYQPSDKTRVAIFSPGLGNLLAYEYTAEAAEANYVYCAGGGEGTARTIAEDGDDDSIERYGRVEMFRDRRDTTETAELAQTIDEELARNKQRVKLTLTPIDTPSLAFVGDYALGDLVTVILTEEVEVALALAYFIQGGAFPAGWDDEAGQSVVRRVSTIQDVVREVRLTITPKDADVLRPTLGTPESQYANLLGLFDTVRKLNGRVSNLERR